MAVEGVRRPAWAEISRSALRHNAAVMRELLGDTAVCAVVKANGYGHGAVLAAETLATSGAAGLAVAILDEGVELRDAGLSDPILLLAETPRDTVRDALEASLTLTIGSVDGARAVVAEAGSLGGHHRIHLKIDTGMHRMGIDPDELDETLDTLASSPNVVIEGIYTHFAVADSSLEVDREYCRQQLARFDEVLARVRARGIEPAIVHTANSAAAIGIVDSRRTMARVGLALYGYLPDSALASVLESQGLRLRPAMSLHARVTAVRDLPAGERPSYGRRRELSSAARVATVPFGYADGYPRRMLESGAYVLINGERHPLAGAVTMDQLVVDCNGTTVVIGDEVVLLGTQGGHTISAETWATWAETITWEILCGIGARVPRVVVE
jgi:alanine racemase